MEILSVQQTTYGKSLDRVYSNVEKSLLEYITTSSQNLNYEYIEPNGCKIVCILGINSIEQELPMWEHPIHFLSLKRENVIAVDLRRYVRKISEQPETIDEVAKSDGGCNFLMLLTILIADSIKVQGYSNIRETIKPSAESFSYILQSLIARIVALDVKEKLNVTIILMHYFYMLTSEAEDKSELVESLTSRLFNSKMVMNSVGRKYIHNLLLNLNHDANTITGLIENIRLGLSPDKRELLDSNSLVNNLSSVWSGPGEVSTMLIAIEQPSVWLGLIYTAVSDTSYKRSRLSTMLANAPRHLSTELKSLTKVIDNYLAMEVRV